MLNVFVGILIAQLGVPLGLIVGGFFNGMVPLDKGILPLVGSLNAILFTSLFGLIYSIPSCLVIGMPAFYLLQRYKILNILSILCVAIAVPFSVSILLGGASIQFMVFTFPIAISGAIIFWVYIRSTGALTSVAT